MRPMVFLVLAGLGAGSAAMAQDTQPPTLPLKLPAHTQPREREIQALPDADRSKLSVDTSARDQKEVDELYRELTHKPAVSGSSTPGK
jgi:hypothetical protein